MSGKTVLEIEGLKVALPKGADRPLALDGLSLSVKAGEVVCLVGESGSGKSLTAGAVMRLLPEPHVHVSGGSIRFGDTDILAQTETQMKAIRGKEISMIFQEPMTALNPVFTVGRQLTEGLRLHKNMSKAQAEARALELLTQVRIPEPARRLAQYPHELSGGMRQRLSLIHI